MLEFFKSKEQRFLNKVERFIDLEKSLYDVNSEIDDIAQDFNDRNNLLTKAIEEETNEELRQKLEQKYDTFTRNHLRRVGEARKHKLSISKSMASLLKKNDDLQKGVDEYKLHKAYNTILLKYRSNEIDLNTCDTLLKAVQHKYIKKTPDGKGGWNYVYEEEGKDKKFKIEDINTSRLLIKQSFLSEGNKRMMFEGFDKQIDKPEWIRSKTFKKVTDLTIDLIPDKNYAYLNRIDSTGKGYGVETLGEVIKELKNKGINKFEGYIESNNIASQNMMKKLGAIESEKKKEGSIWKIEINSNNIQKSQQATFSFMQPYLDTIDEALKNKKETGKDYNKLLDKLQERRDPEGIEKKRENKVKYADNIVFNNEGKLLLLKRSENDKTFPGMYVIPGGHVDFGEECEEAAKRELYEEAGIEVEEVHQVGEYEDKKVHIKYYQSHTDKDPVLQQEEIWGYEWVELKDLDNYPMPLNMCENIKKVLNPYNFKEKITKIKKALEDNLITSGQYKVLLNNVLEKAHKYVRRTGFPGNYKYYYEDNRDTKMGKVENIVSQHDVVEAIDSFKENINSFLRSEGIDAWMYDQESFTGFSHYLDTNKGKIRLSDHGIPSKASKYEKPLKNVVIHQWMTRSEIDNKLNELSDFIKENKSDLFKKEEKQAPKRFKVVPLFDSKEDIKEGEYEAYFGKDKKQVKVKEVKEDSVIAEVSGEEKEIQKKYVLNWGKKVEVVEEENKKEKYISENYSKLKEWLQNNGFEKHYVSKSGSSSYWKNDEITVRLSDHELQSIHHDNSDINGFSDKKEGWKEKVNEIKEANKKSGKYKEVNEKNREERKNKEKRVVVSPKFGEGQVLWEDENKIAIEFKNKEHGYKELLKKFANLEDKESSTLQKALEDNLITPKQYNILLEKAKPAHIGEIREWSGKKMKKVAPDKWEPLEESKESSQKVNWIKNPDYKNKPVELIDVNKLKTNPNEVWSEKYEKEGFGKEYTDALSERMKQGKSFEAIIVTKENNTIIDGQHRYKAAKKAGLDKIGVVYVEIKKSQQDDLQKAWTKHPIGTVVTRKDGQKYRKVSETGNSRQDWKLVAKDKVGNQEANTSPSEGHTGGDKEGKQQEPTNLSEAARNASETSLNNAIKTSDDPKIREAAHQEIDRREKEEKVQEEPEKEDNKQEEVGKEDYDSKIKELENKIRELRGADIDYSDTKALEENTKQVQESMKERQRLVSERDSLRKVGFKEYMKGFKVFSKTSEYDKKLQEHQNKFKLSNLKGKTEEERNKLFEEEEKSQKELDKLYKNRENLRKESSDYYLNEINDLKYTKEEEIAANTYKGNGYVAIRGYLSNPEKYDQKDFNSSMDKATVEEVSNNISTFIQNNKIKDNLVLNRRINGKGVKFFESLGKGDIYEDKSFSSTSLGELTYFGDFNISILAKKGSNIANMGNHGELEYLIDKGSKFRVLDKSDKNIIVELL